MGMTATRRTKPMHVPPFAVLATDITVSRLKLTLSYLRPARVGHQRHN